ncbi:hypothetical protein [Spirilliplanes yamanashiensis]|uniref:Uncharacterized protein n=1 Tax=Spirilliplanes yamanashiensis TaxID=42233 RepID=A0A8J4DI73_9ACTN|nr:hypothetical protein [Spirilliplanes yamanashiensis]MDP9815147.1 hypothetical protein [Spirilliplanes yamanashiensis]GIJ02802.1 hypothetical protein Sya03_21540 [Spirilliplanes yamanashiensis]
MAFGPAVVVLAGVVVWRFAHHLRGLEAEDRRRPLRLAGIVLVVVVAVLGGIWIYVESRTRPPVLVTALRPPPTVFLWDAPGA